MSALEVFTNDAVGTVSAGGTTTSDTAFTVTPTNPFPVASTSTAPQTFFRVVDTADPSEIMWVTVCPGGSTTGQSWTVLRGQEGTTAVAHTAGWTVQQLISAGTMQNLKQTPGSATTAVAVGNTTSEIVLVNYAPLATDLAAGTTWNVVAFGPLGKANGAYTITFNLYWGGSGNPGSTFTSTGSNLLAKISSGVNAPALNTTMAAGGSFDINADITWLTSTTATANMNLWYSGITAIATANNATTTNSSATSPFGSSATAKTISGSGPIILTAVWTGTASASSTLTATAPLVYRAA